MDIGETASSHPAVNDRKDSFPGHRALDQRFRDLWPVEAGHPSGTRSLKSKDSKDILTDSDAVMQVDSFAAPYRR
jgi:hypothetical protein